METKMPKLAPKTLVASLMALLHKSASGRTSSYP
jgi:hypothetical protein